MIGESGSACAFVGARGMKRGRVCPDWEAALFISWKLEWGNGRNWEKAESKNNSYTSEQVKVAWFLLWAFIHSPAVLDFPFRWERVLVEAWTPSPLTSLQPPHLPSLHSWCLQILWISRSLLMKQLIKHKMGIICHDRDHSPKNSASLSLYAIL